MTVTCCDEDYEKGIVEEGKYAKENLKPEAVKGVKIVVSKSKGNTCQFCGKPSTLTLWNDPY